MGRRVQLRDLERFARFDGRRGVYRIPFAAGIPVSVAGWFEALLVLDHWSRFVDDIDRDWITRNFAVFVSQ